MVAGMIAGLQQVFRVVLPGTVKAHLKTALERLQLNSLRQAVREQGLWELEEQLTQIVPDLKHQYSAFEVDSDYLSLKIRGMHAFQMTLANAAIASLSSLRDPLAIVDVGDSAGSHIQYLKALHKERELQCTSVNIDPAAIKRIREKGLQAELVGAEEVGPRGIKADIFLSFEMLEHLESPIQFLRSLSTHASCGALVITVPYVEQSRVGLHHIRHRLRQFRSPETTHIFEFCPSDWRLLCMHAGWKVQKEQLYFQYPKHGLYRTMKPLWKALDFEGFWGAVLLRDHTWSDLYVSET